MKKQIKKSLSLFLAVIMLLSCWVWIAPEKADAASPSQYYVKFTVRLTDNWSNSVENSKVTINYISDNATGSTGSYAENPGGTKDGFWNKTEGQTYTVLEGYIDGFPTSVVQYAKTSTLRTMAYDQATLYIGTNENNCTTVLASGGSFSVGSRGNKTTTVLTIASSKYPTFTYPTAPARVTGVLNKLPGNTATTMTTEVTGGKDNYTADWTDSSKIPDSGFTYQISRTENSINTTGLSGKISVNGKGKTATIKAYPSLQTLFPGQSKITLYLATTRSGNTVYSEIQLDCPTYTLTFDGNGGTLNTEEVMNAQSVEYYCGQDITAFPKSGSKTGMTLIGFVAGGDVPGDITDLNIDYGNYMSYEKYLFPAAGIKTQSVDKDTTYYAVWAAQEINVTFKTQDGQTIAKIPSRYLGELTANNLYKGLDSLNAAIKEACKNPSVQFNGNDPVYKVQGTEYAFTGWKIESAKDLDGNSVSDLIGGKISAGTDGLKLKGDTVFVAQYSPISNKKYSVTFYDENGTAVSTKNDYNFRDNVIAADDQTKAADPQYSYEFLGWATKAGTSGAKRYILGEDGLTIEDTANKVPAGVSINYIDKDTQDWKVRGDAEYVPVFKATVRSYTVTYNYYLNDEIPASETATFKYGDIITFPEVQDNYTFDGKRYTKTGWSIGNDVVCIGDLSVDATYDSGVTAVYTIEFYDRLGNLIAIDGNADNTYNHRASLAAPDVAQNDKDDNFVYTFIGWSPKVPAQALADGKYYAQYERKAKVNVHFMNEGIEIADACITDAIEGDKITFSGTAPTKEADKIGTYTFKGWTLNGNPIDLTAFTIPGDSGRDIYLEAEYEVVKTPYTVTFNYKNENGEDVADKATYYYGDDVTVPADLPRYQDNTYAYTFAGWDKAVTAKCVGDAEYTALYSKDYVYYTVTWYNENGSVYKTQKYTYNQRINAPASPAAITTTPSDENHEIVFDAWLVMGEDGSTDGTVYVRGDRITANAAYKASYKEVGKTVTVNFFDENNAPIGSAKIPYGSPFADALAGVEQPVKAATDDVHYTFGGWKVMATGDIISNTALVTADILDVKASFAEAAHSYALDMDTIQKYPTCMEEGYGTWECSCGKHYDAAIPAIPDDSKPDGTIYIDGNRWTVNQFDGTVGSIDYDEIVYAGPNSNLVAVLKDTGTWSKPFNLDSSITSRIDTIEVAIANGKDDNYENLTYSTWFDYATRLAELTEEIKVSGSLDDDEAAALAKAEMESTYEANLATSLSRLGLTDGEQYVAYFRITDRKGNVSYASTGTILYDATAPEVSLTSKNGSIRNQFCMDATITASDNNAIKSVTLNGKEITLDKNGEYAVKESGLYNVVVTDIAGNVTAKSFEIRNGHITRTYTTAATCEAVGSVKAICTICGKTVSETTIPALGHDMTDVTVIPATCTSNEIKVTKCKNGCGKTETEVTPDSMLPHSYPEDADGNAEWIVDIAATCVSTGSKHRSCTVCGTRETVEIAIDENAHKYYRPYIGQEPTCTESGWYYRDCKYDTTADKTHTDKTYQEIPATGHTAGEWIVTTEPTCTEAGEKKQYCSVCDAELDKGTVAALGHRYKWVEYVAPTAEEGGYNLYRCTVCDEEYKDYDGTAAAEKYTVTFLGENGDQIAAIEDYEGSIITAADITIPEKAADVKNTYTFSHWETADGTVVNMPITIDGDLTVKAVYKATPINYTVTYYEKDGTTQYMKVGYLNYDQKVALRLEGPAKSETNTESYEFIGWEDKATGTQYLITTDADGNKVAPVFTVNGDASFKAVYKSTTKTYTVVFAYNAQNVLATVKVTAGTSVAYPADAATPTKACDGKYHYTFKGWDKALTSVESNIFTTPVFDKEAHCDFTTTQKTPATCTEDEVLIKACGKCDYKTEIKGAAALGHDWDTVVKTNEETGERYIECKRCDATKPDDTTFTIQFLNYDDSVISTVAFEYHYGDTIKASDVPTAKRAEDDAYTYTFSHWTLNGEKVDDITKVQVTGRLVFKAEFKAVAKAYNVIFRYDGGELIEVHPNTAAGTSVTFGGNADDIKVPAYEANYHYVFSGWKVNSTVYGIKDAIPVVDSEVQAIAVFNREAHTYTTSVTPATCTKGEGTTHTCVCGFSYTEETSAPLGHKWVSTGVIKLPTEKEEGSEGFVCTVCGETKTESIPMLQAYYLTVNVKDTDGKAVSGALVSVYDPDKTGDEAFVIEGYTDGNGTVVLRVPEAKKYTVLITYDGKTTTGDATANEDGTSSSNLPQINVHKCSCACHGDGLWSSIFRFFHKLIKMLTGEFKCCDDPDPRY